ncbi:MAG: hypothetical protein JXJ22_16050 [Bacteroidales bacterium]|nr:hypothetical protein [Bacteroidales bacterium]
MEELVKVLGELSSPNWTDFIEIIISVGALIISSIALWFAIIINKKIDRPIIEKQLSTLYNLIECLQNTNLDIGEMIEGSKSKGYVQSTENSFYNFINLLNDLDNKKHFPLLTTKSYFENLDFIRYYNNPFIPKTIAELLGNFVLDFNKLQPLSDSNNKGYIIIGKDKMFSPDASPYYILENEHIKSFGELLRIFKNIDFEINKWIKKPKPMLNLR